MSVDLDLELNAGIIGGSIDGNILNLSLSVPIKPGVFLGGTVFFDLSNGGSIVGGSFDVSILKYLTISIGRKGCTEFITISIGVSPPKVNDSGSGKGKNDNNGSGRGNSRNNGKNNHGGRTNRNNRNRDKPPIRMGENTRIQDPNTRLQNDNTRLQDQENNVNDRIRQLERELSDMRDGDEKSSKIRELERLQDLQDNLQDRNHNLQDNVQDRIRDKPRDLPK